MRCSVDTSLQVYVGLKKVILPRKNQDEKYFNNKKKNTKNPQGQILRQIVSVTIANLL